MGSSVRGRRYNKYPVVKVVSQPLKYIPGMYDSSTETLHVAHWSISLEVVDLGHPVMVYKEQGIPFFSWESPKNVFPFPPPFWIRTSMVSSQRLTSSDLELCHLLEEMLEGIQRHKLHWKKITTLLPPFHLSWERPQERSLASALLTSESCFIFAFPSRTV